MVWQRVGWSWTVYISVNLVCLHAETPLAQLGYNLVEPQLSAFRERKNYVISLLVHLTFCLEKT